MDTNVVERHVIVAEGHGSRVIAMDSITHANPEFGPDDVLIGGSFAGVVAVQFATRYKPRAIIANDSGVGLAGAGINGLWFCDGLGIPAVALDGRSVRLADGVSMWETGVVSYVNYTAQLIGCQPGQTTREVAKLLLAQREPVSLVGEDGETRCGMRETVLERDGMSIVAAGTIRYAQPEDVNTILCLGSHGGVTASRRALVMRPAGFISSDGGPSLDDAGKGGLPMLDQEGIPGATVDANTAFIGDGLSTYRDGIINAANSVAQRAGVRVGQPAREAALAMLLWTVAQRKQSTPS